LATNDAAVSNQWMCCWIGKSIKKFADSLNLEQVVEERIVLVEGRINLMQQLEKSAIKDTGVHGKQVILYAH